MWNWISPWRLHIQHHAFVTCTLRFAMDITSLLIFLVYFVGGIFLVLCDPVDRTCGWENQINSITRGFIPFSAVHTVTKQLIQQASIDLLTIFQATERHCVFWEFYNSDELKIAIAKASCNQLLFNCWEFFFFPAKPSLDKVAETQFVLLNHSSSLWCPVQGAPAPVIVWRKNGIVKQNSTSVLYQLKITGENNDNYSCEVNTQDGFNKERIHLVIESEF